MKLRRLRQLDEDALQKRLNSARKELMDLRSQLASGGSIESPGKIKHLKQEIARILTIQKENSM